MGNSDHVVVSVSIDFPSNLQWDTLFHRIVYDYSRAEWDGLCDHLRDVPWKDIYVTPPGNIYGSRVMHLIICEKSQLQYVGETVKHLKARLNCHKSGFRNLLR